MTGAGSDNMRKQRDRDRERETEKIANFFLRLVGRAAMTNVQIET